MSNSTQITIDCYVSDFISIEHGEKKITMTIFLGRDSPAKASSITFTPYQAEIIAGELMNRAKALQGGTPLTRDQHKARHLLLHHELDELLADFLRHTNCEKLPTKTFLSEFIHWSFLQTEAPTGD